MPGGEVWIGPETYKHLTDDMEIEEVGPQAFKGKEKAVTVYGVAGVS